jgi:hypothetical protein
MNTDDLIVEARAKITWGDEPKSVRYFLTSNGMSAAEADASIKALMRERIAEVKKLGLRDVLIGVTLIGVAGVFFYCSFTSSHVTGVTANGAKGYGVLAVAALYGLWRLVNGIIRLVRPKAEHGSIPDL